MNILQLPITLTVLLYLSTVLYLLNYAQPAGGTHGYNDPLFRANYPFSA